MIFDTTISIATVDGVHNTTVRPQKFIKSHFEDPKVLAVGEEKTRAQLMNGCVFRNNRRSGANVIENTMLTIDIDDTNPGEFADALDYLEATDTEYLYYTTYSHHPPSEIYKYRLLIALNEPIGQEHLEPFINHLAKKIGLEHAIDGSSAHEAQGQFMPVVCKSRAEFYEWSYFCEDTSQPLIVDQYFDEIPEEVFNRQRQLFSSTYDPLPIPAGLNEAMWMAAITEAYPAAECGGYNEWLQMGMALHHQYGGDPDKYNVWINWSRLNVRREGMTKDDPWHGNKISESTMIRKWQGSFKDTNEERAMMKKGVTIRTILNKDKGAVLSKAYSIAMSQIDDSTKIEPFVQSIAEDQWLPGPQREKLKTPISAAWQNLFGVKIGAKDVAEMISPKQDESETKWAEDWWYSLNTGMMHNINDPRKGVEKEDFNILFGSMPPLNLSGTNRPKPLDCMQKSLYGYSLNVADGIRFLPGKNQLVNIHGETFLNTYIPPPVSPELPFGEHEIDSHIKEMIDVHLSSVCGNRAKEKKYVLQHLAWLRKEPSKRIHKGMCITSIAQGIGKSVLKLLYTKVLGHYHIGHISTAQVKDDERNKWMTDPVMVTFMEEITVYGAQRTKVFNTLKEVITEDKIAMRAMYKDAKAAYPSTCLVLFSNETSILGDAGAGRRWSVITSPWVRTDQIEEFVLNPRGIDKALKVWFKDDYLPMIHGHTERLIAYIDSVSLEGFDPDVPLDSDDKNALATNTREAQTALVIRDIIEDELTDLVNDNVILFEELASFMENRATGKGANNPHVSAYLATKKEGRKYLLEETLYQMGFFPATKLGFDAQKRVTIGSGHNRAPRYYSTIWATEEKYIHQLKATNRTRQKVGKQDLDEMMDEI